MNTNPVSRLDPSSVALRLGLCAAALAGVAAPVSDANAVVVTFNTPIPIPATFEGVYINLLTGANDPDTAAVPGWDFGPWGTTTLNFFWAGASGAGGVGGATYTPLAVGATISGASTFLASAASAATAPFRVSGTHVLGFRFFNESTSAINYGYLTMETTGPSGFPATVTGWSFENSGGSITVVPEPSTALMLSMGALALGAVNLRRMRRKGRQLAS